MSNEMWPSYFPDGNTPKWGQEQKYYCRQCGVTVITTLNSDALLCKKCDKHQGREEIIYV